MLFKPSTAVELAECEWMGLSGGLSGEYTSQPVAVPQNHKRALCDLTVADRLALYDHVTGELNQQRQEATANEDLYVDLVAKLKRGRSSWEPYRLLQDTRCCYYPDMFTASGLKNVLMYLWTLD